jgi:hypothetical protein
MCWQRASLAGYHAPRPPRSGGLLSIMWIEQIGRIEAHYIKSDDRLAGTNVTQEDGVCAEQVLSFAGGST